MTDNTEPTIDENMVIKLILNAELWTICKPYTSNPPVAEQAMIDDLIVYIKALISDQVAKARIEELQNIAREHCQKPIPEKAILDRIAELNGVKNR